MAKLTTLRQFGRFSPLYLCEIARIFVLALKNVFFVSSLAKIQPRGGVVLAHAARGHGPLAVQRAAAQDGRGLVDGRQAGGQGGRIHGHRHQAALPVVLAIKKI